MPGGVKRTTIQRWLPAVVWMAVIFVVSSRSQPPGPANPTLDWMWKKSVHVASYALLAILVRYALGSSPRAMYRAFVLTLLYAVSDEFHQSFVPGRTARVTDVQFDMAGATLGLAALQIRSRVTVGTTRSLRGRPGPADDEGAA